MSISARDLFFVLRAKDEATGILARVSRDLLRVGASAEAATRQQIAAVEQDAAAWDRHARSLEENYRQHQRVSQAIKSTSDVLAGVGIGLIGFSVASLAAIGSTVKASIEYAKAVALTKTQVDGFQASLQQLSQAGLNVANNIAAPFESIQPALYNIFSSTNANLQQGITLLNAFAKAAVAGNVSIEQASKGTMAILNGFSLPFEKVNDILDIQFQLVRKGVGTYGDFNNVLGRIIPSAQRANQTFQTIGAMLAFMTRNGQSAAMSATAGARALDAFSNPIAVRNLEKMGITMRDATGALKPLPDILIQLRSKIMQLPPADRVEALANAFKGAGGTIQAMRFINEVIDPMHSVNTQLEAFLGFVGDMNNATGQFDQAYATMADTAAAKTQLLKNRWEVLKVTVGELVTPYLANLIGKLDDLLGRFNALPESTKKSIVNTALVVSAISGIAGVAALATSAVGYLATALEAIGLELGPAIAVIALVAAAIVGLGYAFKRAYQDSGSFRDFIRTIGKDFRSLWKDYIQPFIFNVEFYFDSELKPSLGRLRDAIRRDVLPALKEFFAYFSPRVKKDLKEIVDFLQTDVKGAFHALGDVIDKVLIPVLKTLKDFWDKHKTGIKQVADAVEWAFKQFGKLSGMTGIGLLLVILAILVIVIAGVIAIIWAFAEAVAFVVHVISDIISGIKWLINELKELRQWVASAIAGIRSQFGALSTIFGEIPGIIRAALGNVGSILYAAGRSIMDGLINGIRDSINTLQRVLAAVTTIIIQSKGPPEVDKKLLFRSGKYVMQGFMRGVDSSVPALKNQLRTITASISPTVNATVTGQRASAVRPSSTSYVFNQNITVNEARKSGRQLGVEIGFQLQGRVR